MAVTSCSVTNVATPTTTSSSNLLNVLLLSSLLGCGTSALNANTLAGLLALSGQGNLALAIPFGGTSPVLSVLPTTGFGVPGGLFGGGGLGCALPGSNNALSSILLLSLLGGGNLF